MSSELNLDTRLEAFWVHLTLSRENVKQRHTYSKQILINTGDNDRSLRTLHFRSLEMCAMCSALLNAAETHLFDPDKMHGWIKTGNNEEKSAWLKQHVEEEAKRKNLDADLMLDAMLSAVELVLADADIKYALSFEQTTDRTFT